MQDAQNLNVRTAAEDDHVAIHPMEAQLRLPHIFAAMSNCF